MKERLLNNWSAWRIIRLVLSVALMIIGAFKLDVILVLAGVFLLLQALFNTCVTCATGNCEVPQKK